MPRPQRDQLSAELRPTVERAVASVGFDLEEIDIRPAGRRHLVRVVVDADTGVGLDDIASLSRLVAAELDECDEVLGGPYTLEVTSPGVDRPLTAPRHWRRARLRQVEVALRDGAPVTGRVGDAGADAVVLLVGGALREVRYDDVERAAVVVEFRHPPEEELMALGGRGSEPTGPAPSDRDDVGEVAEEHR
ncbi:MAG TPA: ribosome maturation factor RimP [Pseudonocardia sp.]|jgi:ribosome maturation factor RimP|nr:ribosome maturation factor RimP [Pseudonocardia sp.]